jgi:hypothetical protein
MLRIILMLDLRDIISVAIQTVMIVLGAKLELAMMTGDIATFPFAALPPHLRPPRPVRPQHVFLIRRPADAQMHGWQITAAPSTPPKPESLV